MGNALPAASRQQCEQRADHGNDRRPVKSSPPPFLRPAAGKTGRCKAFAASAGHLRDCIGVPRDAHDHASKICFAITSCEISLAPS